MATLSNRLQDFLGPLRSRLKTWQSAIVATCVSFLLGRLVNALSGPPMTALDTIREVFWLWGPSGRPLNSISWMAAALPFIASLTRKWLERHLRDPALLEEYLAIQNRFIPFELRHLFHGAVAWGPCCTLQLAPFLREGWSLSDIRIELEPRKYTIPKRKLNAYKDYRDTQSERFRSDRPKYALCKQPPFALTDDSQILLRVAETRFSEVQFFKDRVAGVQAERDELVVEAREKEITFPNAFCLHLMVVTSDSQLLLVHRSHRLAYNANVWSLSIEEQMAREDISSARASQVFSRWSYRILHEELGITDEDIRDTEFRALSVFLEADVLNCSIAAVAFLPIDSHSLDTVIRAGHRPDREFDDWRYLKENELLSELLHPSRTYHTTTPYRMLVFLASRSSFRTLVRRIVSQDKSPPDLNSPGA